MSLKEQMQEDLALFFDIGELAGTHTLAGRKLALVADRDSLSRVASILPGGVFEGDLLLFACTDDLAGLCIQPERCVELDCKPYRVVSRLDEDGVTQLALQAMEGG